MQADAVNRGHADRAGDDILNFLELAVEQIVGLDDLLAIIVKDLPLAGEAKLLLAPFDEEGLELAFQGGDLLADGRLGHIVDLRSFGKAFGFGQIAKDFKAFNLHTSEASNKTYDGNEVK